MYNRVMMGERAIMSVVIAVLALICGAPAGEPWTCAEDGHCTSNAVFWQVLPVRKAGVVRSPVHARAQACGGQHAANHAGPAALCLRSGAAVSLFSLHVLLTT